MFLCHFYNKFITLSILYALQLDSRKYRNKYFILQLFLSFTEWDIGRCQNDEYQG